MHRLALAPLLFVTGCLIYTDDLNHPPTVTVKVDTLTTNLGAVVSFDVTPSDTDPADADHLTVEQPQIEAADEQAPPTHCDVAVVSVQPSSFQLSFYRTGTYRVSTRVSDPHGAQSTPWVTMIGITNAPPRLLSPVSTPTMDVPATVMTSKEVNTCGVYTAGEAIPVQLAGTAVDADQPGPTFADCKPPETLTYNWRVFPPPGSHPVLTRYQNGNCVAPVDGDNTTLTATAPDQICVWPDYGMTAIPSAYYVEVVASDGTSESHSAGVNINVEADGPPCVTGLQPRAGSYVVDPKNPAPFDTLTVDTVADDLDPYPRPGSMMTFAWSLWRESDPVWRVIATADHTYSPDFSRFGVGEHVRIRVEAVDRTGTRAVCDVSQDSCAVASCAATSCNKWMTWDLELR